MTFRLSIIVNFDFVVRNARIQSDVFALRILFLRPISTLNDQPSEQEQRRNALGNPNPHPHRVSVHHASEGETTLSLTTKKTLQKSGLWPAATTPSQES
jgi:hypothetical protein